jgi:hypothetical protein
MLDDKRVLDHICVAFVAWIAFACGSSGGNDGGMNGTDAGPSMDAMASDTGTPDSGAHDTGPRPDSGVDAGTMHYCAVNSEIQVQNTSVMIPHATAPVTTNGGASNVACIDQPAQMGAFTAPIYIRGCLNVIGAATATAAIQTLDVAVFHAKTSSGAIVDPSWDRATGRDRSPANRIPVHFTVDTNIAVTACASRLQLTIGFQSLLANALESETEYVIRARTATTSAANAWATTYYYGIIVRNDNVAGAGGQLASCTPNVCFLRHNFNILPSATLAALTQAANTPQTAAYAMLETYDCSDLPMKNAVAGFSPTPLAAGYIDANGTLSSTQMSTFDDGLFIALGFMGQDTSKTATVTGAIGIERDATCTEEFSGRAFNVFPRSISVLRSSNEIVLHGQH